MTESGQPDWPPPPEESLQPEPPGAKPGSPDQPYPGDYSATMRLIPVPPPNTPPPAIASITTPPQVPGERYIGKYRVRGELGRGGMGTVYLAEQPGLGREVALQALIHSAGPTAPRRRRPPGPALARTSH